MYNDSNKNNVEMKSLKKKKHLGMTITITALSVFLASAVGFIVKLNLDNTEQKTEIVKIIDEKEKVVAELEVLKENYYELLQEKNDLAKEFESELNRVLKIIDEIRESEVNITTYKERIRKLEIKYVVLVRENEMLKATNDALKREIDSSIAALSYKKEYEEPKQIEQKNIEKVAKPAYSNVKASKPKQIEQKNIEKVTKPTYSNIKVSKAEKPKQTEQIGKEESKLADTNVKTSGVDSIPQPQIKQKTKEKVAKLSVSNLDVYAVQVKSNGKESKTDKAKDTNKIKIEFTFAQNEYTPKEPKNYYIQVIDEQRNILSKSGQVRLGSQTLHYTFVRTFDHDNPSLKISEQIELNEPEKGMYFVYIFDQNKMIASKRIILD